MKIKIQTSQSTDIALYFIKNNIDINDKSTFSPTLLRWSIDYIKQYNENHTEEPTETSPAMLHTQIRNNRTLLEDAVESYNTMQKAKHDIEKKKILESFNRSFTPSKDKFIDSLTTYCEILHPETYLDGVMKVVDRYHAIHNFLRNIPFKSNISLLYNTNYNTGRNGKTYRMVLEQQYFEQRGLLSSRCSLNTDGLINTSMFNNVLHYKDEYDFEGISINVLKEINTNYDPSISIKVLYKGTQSVKANMIYLSCHNGLPSNRLIGGRAVSLIHTTDAKYNDNKSVLTNIGDGTALFDGLVKHSILSNDVMEKVFTRYQELLDMKDDSENSIDMKNFNQDVLNLLCDIEETSGIYVDTGRKVTIATLVNKLSKNKYYPSSKARQTVKNFMPFLEGFYEKDHFWANSIIKVNQDLIYHINGLVDENSFDITTEIIDRNKLKETIEYLFQDYTDETLPTNTSKPERKEVEQTVINGRIIVDDSLSADYHTWLTVDGRGSTEDPTGEHVTINDFLSLKPTEGHSTIRSKDNMTKNRFLYESDDMPLDEQEQQAKRLDEQSYRIVHSAGKSIHMIFEEVDVPNNDDEYKFAWSYIAKYLRIKNADQQCCDCSRLSRKPGVLRIKKGKIQTLISNNNNKIDTGWRETYNKESYLKELDREYKESMYTSTDNIDIDKFVKNYMKKHNIVYVEGSRSKTLTRLTGACVKVGFKGSDIREYLDNNFAGAGTPELDYTNLIRGK